jgi:hypothetical protein
MTSYDEKVLQAYADRIYRRAAGLIFSYAFFCAVIGAVIGAMFSAAVKATDTPWWAAVGAIGLCVGIAWGRSASLKLRAEAQQILCQVEVEKNTRAFKEWRPAPSDSGTHSEGRLAIR